MSVGQCQVVRETTMELYIRRLRRRSVNVFHERIVCLAQPLFGISYLFVKCRHCGEL